MQQSQTIGALAAALAKAQGEFEAVPFNTTNKFLGNRYADLGAVIETAKPIIAKYELSVSQLVEEAAESSVGITTILMHSSGEWLSSFVALPLGEEKGKSRAQVAGSIISYLRRYAYSSILGLYAEEETDGNTDPKQSQANVREHGTHTVAPTAEDRFDPRSRNGKGQPGAQPGDVMPEDPAKIRPWFRQQVEAMKELPWSPEVKTNNARSLAISLKTNGMSDQSRKRAYELLTGHDSGADMDPRELCVLQMHAHETQKLLKMVRSATSEQSPARGG